MNNQTPYWVWLQHILGYGSKKTKKILNKFTFAEDFYRASLDEKMSCGCFTKGDIVKLQDTSLEYARKIIQRCEECGIDIINIGDVAYPHRLMNIENPPVVLYTKGNKEILSDFNLIGMVGTRTATSSGQRNAEIFAYNLARSGYTIVSGGAVGIDIHSHQGTLKANGRTVCVLGCGIMSNYLIKNREIKEQILKKGAIISEYPPDMRAAKYTFPLRNRIISGLSRGVLVIEAGAKSGSLITTNVAIEQNRDIFAVPGDISSEVSIGTNQLIKDGAYAVTAASDIIDFYSGKVMQRRKTFRNPVPLPTDPSELFDLVVDTGSDVKKKPSTAKKEVKKQETKKQEVKQKIEVSLPKIAKEDFDDLSDNMKKVLLSFENDILHIDEIVERTGLPIYHVHSAITLLELGNYIKLTEGRKYKILVSIE